MAPGTWMPVCSRDQTTRKASGAVRQACILTLNSHLVGKPSSRWVAVTCNQSNVEHVHNKTEHNVTLALAATISQVITSAWVGAVFINHEGEAQRDLTKHTSTWAAACVANLKSPSFTEGQRQDRHGGGHQAPALLLCESPGSALVHLSKSFLGMVPAW